MWRSPECALQAAAAIELVHAYSLVHDDLPCMDNDVLRRGKPTVHVKYGEALALLAGDALQTLAFATLSRCALPAAQVLQMVQVLAQASGANGMAGGQAIDLASVGKMAGTPLTQDGLEHMHRLKTGALLRASVQIGGICGNLNAVSLQALDVYAAALGLAFQVIDDILDVEADSITLGKTAGKDAQHAKPTYVSILGLANAKRFSQELQQQGHLALEKLPGAQSDWQRLHELLDYVVVRRH